MSEISIVIPVYNKKQYVRGTVQSVLNQTFTDFELLLVDDGSTDGSGKICDRMATVDNRIRVFHTKNRGVSAARNYGIEKATGKYIGFIDADDRIDRTFLEKLHCAVKKSNSDMAVCGYREIKNEKITDHILTRGSDETEIYEMIRQDLLCILWNKLYVREKIRHLFDEGISTCEDSLFCIRYFTDNDARIEYVNEILYGYRVREGGLTTVFQEKAFTGINKLLKANLRLSARIRDKYLKQAAVHHISKVYFYGINTYIFENISIGVMNEENLSVIGRITEDRKYRKIIRYILKSFPKYRRTERTSVAEIIVILLSLCRMKRSIFIFSKVKKCLVKRMNR